MPRLRPDAASDDGAVFSAIPQAVCAWQRGMCDGPDAERLGVRAEMATLP